MMKPNRTNVDSQYGSVPVVVSPNNADVTASRRLMSSSVNNIHHGDEGESSHLMSMEKDDSAHRRHSSRLSALQYDVATATQDSLGAYSEEEEGSVVDEDGLTTTMKSHGQATIAAEVATIAKNLIGGGILSLSKGIAIYSDNPGAVWSASIWLILLGALFGYYCLLIAKVCKMSGGLSYRGIWTETMGTKGSLAVAIANTLLPCLGNLAYSTILSQAAYSLCQSIGLVWSRVTCLFMVTIFLLLPLCLLKNLHVLAPFSVLGTGAIVLTAIAMMIRLLDGSYQPGGIYYHDIEPRYQPSFGRHSRPWSPAVLPFLCMVFESFVMHYNVPRFYNELQRTSIPRFSIAVGFSFGLSTVLYIVITNVGFLTFGASSDGFILNNYSANDPLMSASRVAVALSTLLIYPIAFIGFRDGVLDIFHVPIVSQTDSNINLLTIFLLSLLTITAVFVTDLGLINAVAGGALATCVCIIFPTIMFREAVARSGKHEQDREVSIAMVLMVIGTTLGIIGVCEAVITTS